MDVKDEREKLKAKTDTARTMLKLHALLLRGSKQTTNKGIKAQSHLSFDFL